MRSARSIAPGELRAVQRSFVIVKLATRTRPTASAQACGPAELGGELPGVGGGLRVVPQQRRPDRHPFAVGEHHSVLLTPDGKGFHTLEETSFISCSE